MAATSFGMARKLTAARSREFSIVSTFKYGYRNREDVTNLPPGVLIVGSQNVLTNVSDRVQIRQGYSVDGAISAVNAPILASFDWLTRGNGEVHMRAGFLTSAGNDGKLQYRYVDALGAITWRDLMTSLTTVNYNFTKYWDTTETLREVLFVNGSSNIYRWNGATAAIASSDNTVGHIETVDAAPTAGGSGYTVGDVLTIAGGTGGTVTVVTAPSGVVTAVGLTAIGSGYSTGTGQATTGGTGTGATINITAVGTGQITISGTQTVANSGFYVASGLNLVINGNTYSYTGVFGNSFIGISPDSTGEAVGSVIINAVITTSNASMTGIPATFPNSLIATLNNQIFVGSTMSSAMYISNVNSYTDYSSSTPRQSGEGATLILDDNLIGFIQQENFMYVTAGQDLWYNVSFTPQTSTVGVSYEEVDALPLTTGRQQAAISQAFLSHIKNDVIVATQETTIDTFGRIETSLATPQTTNLSDPIKLDIDSYDFTDGSIFYFQYNIYVAVPKEGLVLVYNLATKSWESPQTLPISRFYIVNGELYGHSYNTSESYKLFTGYADRVYPGFTGYPISANWVFSYENYGSRFSYKSATKLYIEGYINANTILTCMVNYELDGCQTSRSFTLDGSDKQFVCIATSEASLGKQSLGKQKLGGDTTPSINGLPPKFRWIPTFTNKDFFEASISFSVLGVNNRAEILAFGLAATGSSQEPVQNLE